MCLLFEVENRRKTKTHFCKVGFMLRREDRIRTCDPLVPNQVFYRAELPPALVLRSFNEEDLSVLVSATELQKLNYRIKQGYASLKRAAKIAL